MYSANIEKSKTWAFVHAMRMEQQGSTERSEVPMEGGCGGPPCKFSQKLDCK